MSTENIVGDASSDINFVIPKLQVGFCFDHKKRKIILESYFTLLKNLFTTIGLTFQGKHNAVTAALSQGYFLKICMCHFLFHFVFQAKSDFNLTRKKIEKEIKLLKYFFRKSYLVYFRKTNILPINLIA